MNKISRKKKVFFLVIPILLILLLFGVYQITINRNQDENQVRQTQFNNTHADFKTSYYIDSYNKNSSDDLKSQDLIYISDPTAPIYFEYAQVGSSTQVIMNLYYDYKPISFQVADKEYSDKYIFDIKDGNKVKIPVYIKRQAEKDDKKIHKLLVTFASAPDQNASQYSLPTDFFGINAVYDVVYTKNYKNEVFSENDSSDDIIPENNFSENLGDLILNTDYKNKEQNTNGGILKPPVSLEHKKGTPLKLMYNFEKMGSRECLLLITLNFSPVKINGSDYQIVKLDGEKGTANGQVEVSTSGQSGLYEVVGYIIHDPFRKQQSADNIIKNSYRFTLDLR